MKLPPDYESMTSTEKITYHLDEAQRLRELGMKWADRAFVAAVTSIIFAVAAIIICALGGKA